MRLRSSIRVGLLVRPDQQALLGHLIGEGQQVQVPFDQHGAGALVTAILGGPLPHPGALLFWDRVESVLALLNAAWPFWFFACNLRAPDLQTMTLCCLPRLRVLRREDAPFCHVEFDPGDLREFVLKGFRGMNFLFERAGMSEAENHQRSARIFEYFQTDWRKVPLPRC